MYGCVCAYMYVCVHEYMGVYMYVYMCVCVYMYVCVCMRGRAGREGRQAGRQAALSLTIKEVDLESQLWVSLRFPFVFKDQPSLLRWQQLLMLCKSPLTDSTVLLLGNARGEDVPASGQQAGVEWCGSGRQGSHKVTLLPARTQGKLSDSVVTH